MADRLIFIAWDQVVRGREERALEVFNECIGLYGRLQQAGRIERFDTTLLGPTGSGMRGYFELLGTADQLADVREDREFKRHIADANLIVDNLRLVDGYTNEGVAEQMGIFQEAIAALPALV